MLRSLFIISALACLATASANCVQASIGELAGTPVAQTQRAWPGSYSYTFPDQCSVYNLRLSGTSMRVCSDDGKPPTIRMHSTTQIDVNMAKGGTIMATEYCA